MLQEYDGLGVRERCDVRWDATAFFRFRHTLAPGWRSAGQRCSSGMQPAWSGAAPYASCATWSGGCSARVDSIARDEGGFLDPGRVDALPKPIEGALVYQTAPERFSSHVTAFDDHGIKVSKNLN
jgi:hypothetical protein